MEKGIPTQHKRNSLSEIELDINEYVDDKNQRSPHTIAELEHTDIEPTGPERSSNKKRKLYYTDSEDYEPFAVKKHKPGKIKKQDRKIS
ncbi:hypothetical protein JTB14_030686 [Gonioctena quinquepunctata]|nr:hypothetical protein JTB14_030686 [Gonioctena quinquepunctata]